MNKGATAACVTARPACRQRAALASRFLRGHRFQPLSFSMLRYPLLRSGQPLSAAHTTQLRCAAMQQSCSGRCAEQKHVPPLGAPRELSALVGSPRPASSPRTSARAFRSALTALTPLYVRARCPSPQSLRRADGLRNLSGLFRSGDCHDRDVLDAGIKNENDRQP